MSQADMLLNTLSTDDVYGYSVDPQIEPHIVIGNDRFITVPDELKKIAVEHDRDIETVTFDCPRYWDNHDLSEMQIYINYLLPNGEPGSYIAENISVEGDIMHFTWTISDHVTQMKGNISFLVCAKKTDEDGNETKHWNSELNREMYVSEGLETVEAVISQHPDIITQLLTRMDVVEDISITAEEMNSISEKVQANANASDASAYEAWEHSEEAKSIVSELGNAFANPIRKTLSGKVICMDDVSPVVQTPNTNVLISGHTDVSVVVCSSNLADIEDAVVVEDSAWGAMRLAMVALPSGTYTAIAEYKQEGAISKVALSARNYDVITAIYGSASIENESGTIAMTFTIPEGEHGFQLYGYSNFTANALNTKCIFSNIRVIAGEATAAEYEEHNGRTYTPAIDGTVTVYSVAPKMSVYSTDPNVDITITYNRDTNVVVSEINNKLDDIISRIESLEAK